MPMQHRRRGERRQRRCFAGIAQCQRRKTDFLHRSRRDARSKRRSHHLRAEANAEHRLIGLKPGLDGSDLAGDKRIGFGLVNADRPAQHDDEIGCDERAGVERLDARLVKADVVIAGGEQRAEESKIFKSDVAHGDASFYSEVAPAMRHPAAASSPGSA